MVPDAEDCIPNALCSSHTEHIERLFKLIMCEESDIDCKSLCSPHVWVVEAQGFLHSSQGQH